ncbi:MAG TPA: Holliday junction resolvase RuvX [Candidatus Aminicenantes bacterium]|nr:Holliday junction resolvase RuvX [Candidatus Aminicenantes bacterium]
MSDQLGLTAQPLGTYRLKALIQENKKYFQDLVNQHDIQEIVIGFPLRMDGSAGSRAEKTREFAAWLEKAVDRPIVFWDERLTTREAIQALRQQNVRRKRNKSYEDQVSAVIILAAYLESRRSEFHVS